MSAGTSRSGLHTSRGCAPTAVSAPETKPERGRDERERAGELERTCARSTSATAPIPAMSASAGAKRGVHEVQHVVVQDTRPFERRAQRALGERPDRRRRRPPRPAQADRDQAERRRDRGEQRPTRRRPRACPRARSRRTFPAARAANVATSHVVLPQALPISLAIVSLAAGDERRDEREARADRPASCRRQTSAAQAAMPVLAIALPGPRRPPRSSAMPRSVLRLKPRRVASGRRSRT